MTNSLRPRIFGEFGQEDDFDDFDAGDFDDGGQDDNQSQSAAPGPSAPEPQSSPQDSGGGGGGGGGGPSPAPDAPVTAAAAAAPLAAPVTGDSDLQQSKTVASELMGHSSASMHLPMAPVVSPRSMGMRGAKVQHKPAPRRK